jgi:hypothetical protein
LPVMTLFGVCVPQDVSRKVEINSAAITFIESLHPSLTAPWL